MRRYLPLFIDYGSRLRVIFRRIPAPIVVAGLRTAIDATLKPQPPP